MSVLCEEGLERFWTDAKTYLTGTAVPLMDGTAAVGSSSKFAREDHVHPSDSSKVDKVAGMGLSHNDFTDALKQKLEGLVSYSTMTVAEMEAGTDTTGKLVTAKDLHDTYVNVSGDTMTGDLGIYNDGARYCTVRRKDLIGKIGTPPSATEAFGAFRIMDSHGDSVGWVRVEKSTADSVNLRLTVRRYNASNTMIENLLNLGIDSSGNRTVAVSDAAVWRTALSVYSKTESDNRYVNVTGDTMTGNLTMSSASIKFDNVGYTETISQRISGGLDVSVTGTLYLKDGSTTEYYLQSNDTYHHHFSTTARFHTTVWMQGATYHDNYVMVTGSSFYAKSSNITTSTTATTVGNSYLYFRTNNDINIGWVRCAVWANSIYGIQIAGRSSSGTENVLALRVNSSGTRSVEVSDSAAWRSALGITNIFKIVSVQMTNLTLAAGAAGQFSNTFTIPSGYTKVSTARVAVDGNGTTSPAGTHNVYIMNTWTSGSTCYVVCKNTSTAAVKFTANVDIQYLKTILY